MRAGGGKRWWRRASTLRLINKAHRSDAGIHSQSDSTSSPIFRITGHKPSCRRPAAALQAVWYGRGSRRTSRLPLLLPLLRACCTPLGAQSSADALVPARRRC